MEYEVFINFMLNEWVPVTLIIEEFQKHITLNFLVDGNPLFKDALCSFKEIEFDNNDSRNIHLRGINKRVIRFDSGSSVSSACTYIQKFYSFKPIPGPIRKFYIENLFKCELESNETKKTHEKAGKDIFPISDPQIDFEMIPIESPSFIFFLPESINADNCMKVFSENDISLISGYSIDPKAKFCILKQILLNRDADSMYNKYIKLREQWVSISKDQLLNHLNLQQYIFQLEKELNVISNMSRTIKTVIFDAMMSWFALHFGCSFSNHMFYAAVQLSRYFFSGGLSGQFVYYISGEFHSIIESSSLLFWTLHSFSSIYNKEIESPSSLPTSEEIYVAFKKYLNKTSLDLSRFFDEYPFKDFAFIMEHIQNLFHTDNNQDNDLLFMSYMLVKDKKLLTIAIIAVLIISFVNSSSPIEMISSIFLEKSIIDHFYKMDKRHLIFNVDNYLVYLKSIKTC